MELALWLQSSRPSPHSGLIILSHAAFLLAIATAHRKRQTLELLCLMISMSVSMGYHVCDENLYCAFGLEIRMWHALDVWSTFFLICFVLGVRAMNIEASARRLLLRMAYLGSITVFVGIDRSSPMLFGSLLVSVVIGIAVQFVRNPRMLLERRARPLVLGLLVFGGSLGCFFLANTALLGPPQWTPRFLGDVKPMDVPDTPTYWLLHSFWHAASAVSAHYLLSFNATAVDVQRRPSSPDDKVI